jgi:hypothetical protein
MSGKIYTLDWIENEAKAIMSAWNGQDEMFQYEDEQRTAEDAEIAGELLEKIDEVKKLCYAIGI